MKSQTGSYDIFRIPKEMLCLPRHDFDYDLIVIGSGPAGQKAAKSASKIGANVAMVHLDQKAGGACLNTGTIPSKSFREAVLYLTGYRQRGYYGDSYRVKENILAGDLVERTNHVIECERKDINNDLRLNGIDQIVGFGKVTGENTVEVDLSHEEGTKKITGHRVLISTGTRPRRPPGIPFDMVNIFDSDDVFGHDNELRPLPDSAIVMGAGIIGIEYASMFVALGIPTTILDPREEPLGFVDHEMTGLLYNALEKNGAKLKFGHKHEKVYIEGTEGDHNSVACVELENGEVLRADGLLVAMGRIPNVDKLGLDQFGVKFTNRNHIIADRHYKTDCPWIYAAGDVIGYPALASTSAEQGRVAALHSFGIPVKHHLDDLPYGIYTIPEMSWVGKTEDELKEQKVDYIIGRSPIWSTARGKILGDKDGGLKMLFCTKTQKLLGVHIIGEGATELLHIGQCVYNFGGGLEYFCNTVFNYPTLAECYKIAAYNALNKLKGTTNEADSIDMELVEMIQRFEDSDCNPEPAFK